MSAPDPSSAKTSTTAERPDRGLWDRLGRQLAHPEGFAGALVGRLMAHVNRTPNRLAIEALQLTHRDDVLEIGFGPGQGLAALGRRVTMGRIRGLDGSPAMLRLATRRNAATVASGRMELIVGDFLRLPWSDASFDGVLAVNVAYFFDREGVAVSEIHRVLRPGGRAVFYVTDRASMAGWPFAGPETHVTYDAADLRRLLLAGGFPETLVTLCKVELLMGVKGIVASATRRRS